MSEITLAVTGMTCTDCAHRDEMTIESDTGVRNGRVEYPKPRRREDRKRIRALVLDTQRSTAKKLPGEAAACGRRTRGRKPPSAAG